MAAATDRHDSDEYVTRGYLDRRLDDFRASINRDLRHALDEALGRQSADLNKRMDRKFETLSERIDRLEAKVDVKFDAVDARFDALLGELRNEFAAIHGAINALGEKA